MSTQRYISTSFWDDEWIQTLDPSEKLLYLYLMTNPLTNIAGAYKITVRRMVFDTGFNAETISRLLGKFEKAKKAYHHQEYMILPSWPKHQKWEKKATIKIGIDSELKSIPEGIKEYMVSIGYRYPIEGYPYDPSYSDLDLHSDLDIDLHTDIDIDAPSAEEPLCVPVPVNPLQNDGTSRIEKARAVWNETKAGPPCRITPATMGYENLSACKLPLPVYSDDEIADSIRNYAGIVASPEHEVRSPYLSFVGFMKGGVEKFVTSADPWKLYKRQRGNSFRDQEERAREEAIAMLRGE
jgi:hypothetical protein